VWEVLLKESKKNRDLSCVRQYQIIFGFFKARVIFTAFGGPVAHLAVLP